MFVNASSQPHLRHAMPTGSGTSAGSTEGTHGGRGAWLPAHLAPDALVLAHLAPSTPGSRCPVPAASPVECQGLCALCILCKHCWLPIPALHLRNARLGQGGDLCNELNQKWTLFPPHTSPITLK